MNKTIAQKILKFPPFFKKMPFELFLVDYIYRTFDYITCLTFCCLET